MCSPDRSPYCIERGDFGQILDTTELFISSADWSRIVSESGPFWVQVLSDGDLYARYLAEPPRDWSLKTLSFTAGERDAYKERVEAERSEQWLAAAR